MTVPQLPTDVIGLIAKELQSRFHFRTCANLNMSCRDVFEQTLPILWKLVIFRKLAKVDDPGKWSRLTRSSGAKYIEFLIDLDDAETQQLPPHQRYNDPPPYGATPGKRCKAILCVRKGMVGKQFYAYLWGGYRYGGRDLDELLLALILLRNLPRPQDSANTGTWMNHLHLIPMSEHLSCPQLHLITSQHSIIGEIDWISQIRVEFRSNLEVQPVAISELLLEINRLRTPLHHKIAQPLRFLFYLRTEDGLVRAMEALATVSREFPQFVTDYSGFSLKYGHSLSLDKTRQLFDILRSNFIRAFLLTSETTYIQLICENQHSALTCVRPHKLQLQHLGSSLSLIDIFTFNEAGEVVDAEIGKTTYG